MQILLTNNRIIRQVVWCTVTTGWDTKRMTATPSHHTKPLHCICRAAACQQANQATAWGPWQWGPPPRANKLYSTTMAQNVVTTVTATPLPLKQTNYFLQWHLSQKPTRWGPMSFPRSTITKLLNWFNVKSNENAEELSFWEWRR